MIYTTITISYYLEDMGRKGVDWVKKERDYSKLAKQFLDFIQ